MNFLSLGIIFMLLSLAASSIQYAYSYQVGISFPVGVTYFPLFSVTYTPFVEGVVNLTSLSIGRSFISGQLFQYGNASLQLNVMLNGTYWVQNVMLFHELSDKTFEVIMVVNFWNLTGPFTTLIQNSTIFQGLGVYCYQGPRFNVSLPVSLSLFLNSSRSLQFGYSVNGERNVYLDLPFSGLFKLGGLSANGLPNDLEIVWGGPGGGSSVDMTAQGREELYYLDDGKLAVVPSALSVGLDTAESAYGIATSPDLSNITLPSANINRGVNSPSVLWPIPPKINVTQINDMVKVKLYYGNYTFSNQVVEIRVIKGLSLTPLYQGVTNASGEVVFKNVTEPFYQVYFPGNYSLSQSYALSSPQLNRLIGSTTTAFDNLINFLKTYNFKKALSSDFNHVKYQSRTSVDYLTLEVILGLVAGILISALTLRRSSHS